MELDEKTTTALTALLATANSEKRKKNRMSLEDVLRVVEDALASPHGIAVRHGGAHGMGIYDKTTICLGVVPPKQPGSVVVGLSYCSIVNASPGRSWKDLQPWMKDVSKNLAKAHKWASTKRSDRIVVTPSGGGKAKARPYGDGAALLAQLLAAPDDDGARLVYADHLISIGDPRGELITTQVTLERTPKKKIGERRSLIKQEKALLRKHKGALEKEVSQCAELWEIRRGFVWKIHATAQAFAASGAGLMAREPVEELAVEKPTCAGMAALAKAPHLARLRALHVGGWEHLYISTAKDVTSINELFRSKHFGAIPRIAFHIDHSSYSGRAVPDLSELFHGAAWPGVRELAVSGPRAQRESFLASLATVKAPALEKLWTDATPAQARVLAKAFPKVKINPKG